MNNHCSLNITHETIHHSKTEHIPNVNSTDMIYEIQIKIYNLKKLTQNRSGLEQENKEKEISLDREMK